MHIAVLFGGRSGEHEVSLRSAFSVAGGLADRHQVLPVLIDRRGSWFLQTGPQPRAEGGIPVILVAQPVDRGKLRRFDNLAVLAQPDLFFPVLHGPYGEDGTIQGLLDLAGVPFVGAGVAASAAGMDKELMKALFAQAGMPQVAYRVLRERQGEAAAKALAELGLPVFAKPANLGSSVGISKVKRPEDLAPALDKAFAFDRKVILEAAVDAREIEVSVVGNDFPDASVPGEILPDREFYDYDSKYAEATKTGLRIPAPLEADQSRACRELAVRAFRAIDACGFARVDFFLERRSGRVLVNEINTIPGFTSISMFPKLWEATGLPYDRLLDRLVELALERHGQRSALKTEYGR